MKRITGIILSFITGLIGGITWSIISIFTLRLTNINIILRVMFIGITWMLMMYLVYKAGYAISRKRREAEERKYSTILNPYYFQEKK